MAGRRGHRGVRSTLRVATLCGAFLAVLVARDAFATFRYGDIQISGNLSAQQLFRIQDGSDTFSKFQPVQQRNTFRLQYEQQLVKGGKFLDAMIPGVDKIDFFAYYRFAYDSIFYWGPGPTLETQSGSIGGKLDYDDGIDFPAHGIRGRERRDVGMENVLREVFLDIKTKWPVSFRIGRQQVVWGEALSFRALDSVNALDLSWHLQQEAGLLGKVGFDELRIPAWTFKMLVDLGDRGPFSNQYFEAWDIPFDFQPAYARFLPAPWSIPVRTPFRGGLVLPVEGAAGLQVCLDMTGNPQATQGALDDPLGNATDRAQVDFEGRDTASTGLCPSDGHKITNIREGHYDRRDPWDVNQFGMRYGANALGVGFTLNYMYRRNLGADIPTATTLKARVGQIRANTPGYITISPHETFDPITGVTSQTQGYVRIPAEWYYPYVHVAGFSANVFEEFTGAVYTLEAAYTRGLPISTLNPFGNGLKKKDVVLGAVNFDRPTWIRFLNPRATWLIIGQLNFNVIPKHEDIHPTGTVNPVTMAPEFDGDVGLPNSELIPEFVDGEPRIDRIKQYELVSLLVATTFYRGGSFAPLLAWVNDWQYMPSMEFIVGFDYLPTNNIILSPILRIFTNFGRTVDEPWGVGRLSQWDELQIKATYQF